MCHKTKIRCLDLFLYPFHFVTRQEARKRLNRRDERGMKMGEYTVIIERDEDGYYVGEVVELPGCFTQAKSIDELLRRIKEAIELYIEEEGDIEIKNHFVGVQRVQA